MFDNIYDFKQYLTTLIKCFEIKPVLITVKKPQANVLVEQLHQVILNMIVTKDLDIKVFYYISMGRNPCAYSMGDKDLLSPHY